MGREAAPFRLRKKLKVFQHKAPLRLYKEGWGLLGRVSCTGFASAGAAGRTNVPQQLPGTSQQRDPGAFRRPPVAPPGPAEHVHVGGRADGRRGGLCLGRERAGHCGFHPVQEAPVPTELHPGEPGPGRPAGDALRQLRQPLQQHQWLLRVRQADV